MGKLELKEAIARKEKEVLGVPEASPVEADKDLVHEEEVGKKITEIEERIQKSALSDKYKVELQGKLNASSDKWQKEVEDFKKKSEENFKELFAKIKKDFEEFEKRKEVKDVFECIGPLFVNSAEIQKIINLKSYARKSGHWQKINARLRLYGLNEEKINRLQEILGVESDGKVGPATITAINSKVYEQDRKIEWSTETVHETETKEEFDTYAVEAEELVKKPEWTEIERKTGEDLKSAKTLKDIEDAEKKEREEKRKLLEAMEAEVQEKKRQAQQPAGPSSEPPPEDQPTGPDAEAAPPVAVPDAEAGSPPATVPEPAAIPEVTDTLEVPEDFKALNKRLKLSEQALQNYYQAYLQTPQESRIEVSEIDKNLEQIYERFLKELEEEAAKQALIEAFGKLINGEKENIVDNAMLTGNLLSISQKMIEVEEKLKNLYGKRQHCEESIQRRLKELARWVEENPDCYEVWEPSKKEYITQAIENLNKFKELSAQTQSEITQLEADYKKLSIANFCNQYQFLSNNGQNPDQLLLRAHETLDGEANEFLTPKIQAVLDNISSNPELSEFEKLFYAGKYDEALKFLEEQNAQRNKIPGMAGRMGEHDIVSGYRRLKDTPQVIVLTNTFKFEKQGTFADRKIKEGYTPIPIQENEQDHPKFFLVKEQPDGSISYFWITSEGDQMGAGLSRNYKQLQQIGAEHILTKEQVEELEQEDTDIKNGLRKIIAKNPNIKTLVEGAKVINGEFGQLQYLFQNTINGSKPADFVQLAKGYARKIKTSPALGNLKGNLKQAQNDLNKVAGFLKASGFKDEFEQEIEKFQKNLDDIALVVEEGKIDAFCDFILSDEFSEDSFGRWFVKTGLPMLSAILLATAAVVVTGMTFGLGGVAGIALASAAGAIFGTIGNELGTVGSHYLGKAVYGDEFSNKTLLGKYLTDEKVYNPETGKYEEIKFGELAKIYTVQLVMAFVTTFALMGIGGLILGPYLSKFASRYATATGARGALAKLLNKIPRLSKREVDLLEQKGFNGMLKKVGMEFLEETGEEGVETAAEKAHPVLGFLASLYHCLNGRNVAYKLGKYKIVAEEAVNNNGEEALTTWTFDSRQTAEFTQTVQEEYGKKQGFTVTVAGNKEVITAEKEITLKNGKKARVKMVFKSSKESMSMRQLFRESMEGGKSEIERLYGVRSTGENTYEFDTLTPKGKISLVVYLRREGFVITGDPKTGEFEARKGEESVKFKKSKTQKQSKSSDAQTEEDKKPDDETINKIPDPTLRQRVSDVVNDLWNKTHDYIADNFSKISGKWQKIREQVKQNSKELYEKIEARLSQLTKIISRKKGAKDIFKDGKLIATADILQMDENFLATLFYRARDLGFARKLFGVEGELTAGKIKKAYKRLSLEFHPDRNGGSKQAGEMFKAVGEAKTTLERALAEGKTGPIEESTDKVSDKQKESTWDKKTRDWINAQIKKIQDLQLKQKLNKVIQGLETFTGKKWNQVVQTWGEISAAVGKLNKQLHDAIDAKIQERQAKKAKEKTSEQEVRREQKQQQKEKKKVEEIQEGEEVYILRSSGTIERGWVVKLKTEAGMHVYNPSTDSRKFVLFNEIWTLKTIEARTGTAAAQISVGSEVYVRRSSGGIEKGWVVERINPDGTYRLRTQGATRDGTTKDEIFTIDEIEGRTYAHQLNEEVVEEKVNEDQQTPAKLEDVRTIPGLYKWLDAQVGRFHGHDVKRLKKAIEKYVNSNGEISPEDITRKGGLRDKVIELVELKRMEEIRKQIEGKKVRVNVELSGEVRVTDAEARDVDPAIRHWEPAESADKDWGKILESGHVTAFRRSSPQKLEMTFKNGTKVRLIFPKKYRGDIAALQTQIVQMEKWVQQKFGEQGIRPGQELTILIMEDVPGLKPIRGHGGSTNILLNASDVRNKQNFFDTYLHERTHSILGAGSLRPFNNGIIEGIANYMAAIGVTELGLGRPRILKQSVDRISDEIRQLVRGGMTFEEAFWEYFEKHHQNENYNLNYEYGQAFTEALIKHFNGDLGQFLKLYSELGRYEYMAQGMSVSSLLMRAMDRMGMTDSDIRTIFQETSGIMMLKAYRGNELFDVLLQENPQNIEAILSGQQLETIFGLQNATLRQLQGEVLNARRYITGNSRGRNQSSGAKIIEILDRLLAKKISKKGANQQTRYQ